MQKVIRATERAKVQARRRTLIRRARENRQQRTLLKRREQTAAKDKHAIIQAARIARREDWLFGSLAPRRDSGDSRGTYGTVKFQYVQGVAKLGRPRDYCIAEGDRVVVVDGNFPEQGRIGTVKELRIRAETCLIEGFHMVDVATPQYMLTEGGSNEPIRTVEAPIPLSAVRLVYPLRDRVTGTLKDVIIRELKRTPRSDQKEGLDGRYIADADPPIYLPFPKREEEEVHEHEVDTLRIEVEEKTWLPTLNRPPMPPSIIDELRNKYSVFRDRHDESWEKARIESAAAREREARVRDEMMVTPLEEFKRLKKLEKSKVKEVPLNNETLIQIGKLMAQNKERLLRAKGVHPGREKVAQLPSPHIKSRSIAM